MRIHIPTLCLIGSIWILVDLIYLPLKNGHLTIPNWATEAIHRISQNDWLEGGIEGAVMVSLFMIGRRFTGFLGQPE